VVTTAKYTVLTFLPKNLLEQFSRLANCYFLVIAGVRNCPPSTALSLDALDSLDSLDSLCKLQQIDGISPTGRWTTLVPLSLVLTMSAIKEIVEDFYRHKDDRKTNARLVQVLRGPQWVETEWCDVRTGDLCRIRNGEYFPADLVILASSEPQGMCYIETAQLDGETNLKIRQALDETLRVGDSAEALGTLSGTLRSELPNKRLYNFDASLELDGKTFPLSPKQLLLRGAQLRNTQWAVGAVVFAGKDTKLVRNSAKAPVKRSNIERQANKFVLLLFAFLLLLAILCAIGSSVWRGQNEGAYYLELVESTQSAGTQGFFSFLTFLILFNAIVPISLYVSLELAKVGQAYFLNNDLNMYYAKNDTPALARTSNLNEELGQVEYIFSDKTGTLTRNQMQYRQCVIKGVAYGDMSDGYAGPAFVDSDAAEEALADQFVQFEDPRVDEQLRAKRADVVEFATALAVCHTVIPELRKDGKLHYESSSPDELALVSAARVLGYTFVERSMKSVVIDALGERQEFELLNVLEFNSTRKRMSVIVRTPDKRILLFCKGADSVIYARLRADEATGAATSAHLERFAAIGLRTLCIGRAQLDDARYAEWNKSFHAASIALVDRDGKLDAAAEDIEKNLTLVGATAIEDKLQIGVPDTIALLARAGINIWVLTGDKQETAINIAYSCKLFTAAMQVVLLNEKDQAATDKRLDELLQAHPAKSDQLALVVDGHTLEFALAKPTEPRFLLFGQRCKAVVACRVSPAQKAEVVKLVRNGAGAISLAIGDGANDVAMIQAAHVGIGISGEEGLQAARAADYAIAQFRFLQPLLLVHGRLAYRRVARLINYSFYKNLVLVATQAWFSIINGFSGQSLYEQWTLAAYNAIFTLLPVIVYGFLDRDVSDSQPQRHPALYLLGQRSYYFSVRVFVGWMAVALVHATVIFFLTAESSFGVTAASGRDLGLYPTGITIYTTVLITVTLKLALETQHFTWISHLAYWGSLPVLWILFQLVYSLFGRAPALNMGSEVTHAFYIVAGEAPFWFSIVIVSAIALWRDLSWKYVKRTFFPQLYHIVQEADVEHRAALPDDVDEAVDAANALQAASDKADALKNSRSPLVGDSKRAAAPRSRAGTMQLETGDEDDSYGSTGSRDVEVGVQTSDGKTAPHKGYAFSESAGAAANLGRRYRSSVSLPPTAVADSHKKSRKGSKSAREPVDDGETVSAPLADIYVDLTPQQHGQRKEAERKSIRDSKRRKRAEHRNSRSFRKQAHDNDDDDDEINRSLDDFED
jgi:phospholipid-transporting ATPase